MAAVSTAVAQHLLGGLVGDDRVAGAPATFYVALSSTMPTMTGGVISGVTEPAAGGYARVAVANTSANWTATGRSVSNTADISFPEVTAAYAASPAYYVVYDAATAGTALFWGALTAPVSPTTGDTPILVAGTVTLTVEE